MTKLINRIKKIDKPILKVMFKGINISSYICLASILILFFYNTYPTSHIVYTFGLILFRTGLMFAIYFFMCAFAIDTVKKQINGDL